jgi:8-oxo-dGTP pyrophosphatase MutT (NUDIX family)
MTAVVRPASTLVLLRQGAGGPEVFLVRRHHAIAFMGGAHVFPGGRVEGSDGDARWLAVADGFDSALARMPGETPTTALAFCVAALRETFEEVGVLLVRGSDGELVSLAGSQAPALAAQRRAVSDGNLRLLDLVRSLGWRLALDTIIYFAHWVTPVVESRRFDTRFFLAGAPADQVAAHDDEEAVESLWVRPADALARCRAGELALPPPTWTTLRWLEPFRDVEAALAWARAKPVPRIEPGFIERGEARIVTLPGDPTMAPVSGFEAPETRILLSAGRWTPLGADDSR